MSNIKLLSEQIKVEAEREEFPLDISVYNSADKDPYEPILYAGNLQSNICFFGRDLGRDEVIAGEPLIGASGTLVRQGFYQAIYQEKTNDRAKLELVKSRLMLTNTVPYKPPENKAYSQKVKKRFRPFVEQLLINHWQGTEIITLGTEAFKWFSNYSSKEEFNEFWSQGEKRYQSSLKVNLTTENMEGKTSEKKVKIYPLPHPSPLNQRYYSKFPYMLENTLSRLAF